MRALRALCIWTEIQRKDTDRVAFRNTKVSETKRTTIDKTKISQFAATNHRKIYDRTRFCVFFMYRFSRPYLANRLPVPAFLVPVRWRHNDHDDDSTDDLPECACNADRAQQAAPPTTMPTTNPTCATVFLLFFVAVVLGFRDVRDDLSKGGDRC